jgi:hypothetical protein
MDFGPHEMLEMATREAALDDVVLLAEATLSVSLLMGFWEPRHMAVVHDIARFDKAGLLKMLKILADSKIPERMAGEV